MANWRKAVGWTAITVGALLIVLIVAAFVLLRSQGFHRWVVAKIEQKASQSTGARIELQNFDVHLKNLTVDLYGLTVHGTEPPDERPLLQIPKATVGIKIISILHRKVNLSELLVQRPVVNLSVNKEGRSNLPTPPASKGQKSSTNVFDLAVGHVLLANGAVYLRDRKLPVDANLFGLRTEITFSQLQKKYSGSMEYANGTIYYGALKPLPHSLNAKFDASPSELNLNPLVLKLGGSQIQLNANVRDYSSTPLANGHYKILLHTQDFAGLSSMHTAGDVLLTGTLNYLDLPNQAMLKNAKLNGDLSSNGLAIETNQAALEIQKLAGRYQLADGNFRAEGFAFNLLNGVLKADGTIQHIDSTRQSQFHLQLAGVSLQALKSSLRTYKHQSLPVTGTLNAKADATWSGNMTDLRASSSILMRGSVVAANKSRSQSFPLNADLRVNYDAPRSLISVPVGTIQLPATSVDVRGTIGDHSNLSVRASSNNLHQLLVLVNGLESGSETKSSSPLANVEGALTLNAIVQGTMQNPQINAQLSATKLQVNQGQFSSLQLALSASPSAFSIQNGSLNALPRGQLQFSARAGLHRWAYSPSAPITASLHIRQMPLAMLDQIATRSYPITGDLNGDANFQGSEINPAGQGKLVISKARMQDEPLRDVTLQFTASGGTIHSKLSEGPNCATLNYTPKTKAYEVKLEVPPQEISRLHAVQARNLGLKGKLSIAADGAGTIEDPKFNANVKMQDMQVRGTTVSQVELSLNVADHNAKFALNSSGGPANLHGSGTVRLTPGYYAEASVDTSKFPLDPLLAMYMPSRPSGLSAETELHASIRGPLADKNRIEAHLTIPTFEAQYQQLQLASTGPIRVDYVNSVVVLQPVGFKGTDTSFQFQGRVPLSAAGKARMSVTAKGSVDLRLAQMINPDLQTGGKVTLNVSASGNVKNPGMKGQIKIEKASFATEAAPIGISNLNATMDVNDTGIQVTNAVGDLGGGQVKFGGSIIYRPQLEANLSLTGNSVRLRYPEGMRTVFDTQLTLTGNSQASTLQGRVLIDSISFTSDFDLSSFMTQFTGTSAPPTGQSFADNLKLQITVQSSSQLSAGTAQLGIEGQANLRVIGTASNPVIVGRTDITSGDLFFQKREYHFEQGVINFVNPNKTDPVLNLLITTTINQYNLSIRLTGPIEKLQTSYLSDPPLPPVDIIKLLAFGTAPGAPETFGADTVLAQGLGQVESTIGSNISKLTGVAGLQIDPLIGGNNANPSARIGFQKRVTKNFLFTFSTDVTQPQNEIVQGEYQLNKRWSVSVVRDESGGFSIDGRFHTNF